MSKHREAFKAFLELKRYTTGRECDNCCFCLGKDHDNDGYCPFNSYFVCPQFIAADYEHTEISERVYFLEQLELEQGEKQ